MVVTFVIVTKQMFLSRQEAYTKSLSVAAKYDALFQAHECFTTKQVVPVPNRHHSRNHHVRKASPYADQPPRHTRDPKKMLQSLFNILNDSNYAKVLHKLKFIVSNDNLVQIMTDILKNGVRHHTYRKHFIRLILDLMHIWDKEVISHTVLSFFADFMKASKRISLEVTESEYDTFCSQQKHKQRVLNTNLLFLDAYDMFTGRIQFDLNEYLGYIIKEMNDVKQVDDLVDLFLNILCQFTERHTLDILPYKSHIMDLPVASLCVKNRFLIEKIMHNIHQ